MFEDNYFSPIKNTFTAYSEFLTLHLIRNIYGHYAQISSTNLVANNSKIQDAYNPEKQLESLYMRFNK